MNTTVLFRQRGDKRGPAAVTAMLVMLVLPFLATVYALYDAVLHGVPLFFPLLGLVLYIFTGFGITVGYHRLFTHQSFTASPLIQHVLGIGGLMALQGSIRDCCGQHHTHHVHSDRHALFWVVMSFAIPTVAGFAYTQTLDGAWLGLLWGGGVRVFVLHHVTWAVNSVCHVWGIQPFKTKD